MPLLPDTHPPRFPRIRDYILARISILAAAGAVIMRGRARHLDSQGLGLAQGQGQGA